ncbi:ribonuclease HI [Cetobacterium ceti]|uniref:Ribonuclease HI n=1 Tax=Cetobacterium ceti TaxID=180163 RepID=A0A1T4KX20_9FUSO|nr:ribonuclease H family protein [Cetobacterium ceti]SJZ46941.1 ribonuclease HI [Cetobacterium ceti]
MGKKFYAYVLIEENSNGIVDSWDLCKEIITGKKTRYKSFKKLEEAKDWLSKGGVYEDKKALKEELKKSLREGVFFDAGTGRGIGVEVRVTDIKGLSYLPKHLPSNMVNEFGNFLAPDYSTNNYGELIGLFLAIDIALKENLKEIFGDSKLVIDYWSKGAFKKDNLNDKTVSLIEKVILKRKNFESLGGKISHVSGDINPADLGFHK